MRQERWWRASKTGENPAWPSCQLHSSVSVSRRALSSPPFRRRYTYAIYPRSNPSPYRVSRVLRSARRTKKSVSTKLEPENRLGLFSQPIDKRSGTGVARAFLFSAITPFVSLSRSLSLLNTSFSRIFACLSANAPQTDRDRIVETPPKFSINNS